MKYTLLAIAFCFSTIGHAQWGNNKKIKGNGKMTTETRTTKDYDQISCSGNFDYILVSGNEGQLKLEGEENLLPYIITEVKGNNLVVKVEDNINLSTSGSKTIKITIPFESISSVALAGSGDLWTEDTIKSDKLQVSLAGSGDVTIKTNANTVEGSLAGSGDLTLKGSTNKLKASIAGSGDIHGFDLTSDYTEVAISGSGDAKVVCHKELKARVAGSGDIQYKGNPLKEDSKVAGSGSISN
ncbi:MAG: DUF2807 domain-containing protein [Bacteroidetes bacterium MedPE-SWsnd-G2]|nr:MAG: DUF2807 domain-containing protein [Bacteroidetes bacterium MedPE-SWsnd-G2]